MDELMPRANVLADATASPHVQSLDDPPGRRRRILWLAVAGAAVVIGAVLLLLPVRTHTAVASDVVGRWVSTDADAPGELVLEGGGVARSVGLTFYDQRSKSEQIQASHVTAVGTWTVVEGQVY